MEKLAHRNTVLWEYKGYVALYSLKQLRIYDINILPFYNNLPHSSEMVINDYYNTYVLERTRINLRKEPPDSRVKTEINKYRKEHP